VVLLCNFWQRVSVQTAEPGGWLTLINILTSEDQRPETTTYYLLCRVEWAVDHIDPIQFSAQVAGESKGILFLILLPDARCGFHDSAANQSDSRRLTDGRRGPPGPARGTAVHLKALDTAAICLHRLVGPGRTAGRREAPRPMLGGHPAASKLRQSGVWSITHKEIPRCCVDRWPWPSSRISSIISASCSAQRTIHNLRRSSAAI